MAPTQKNRKQPQAYDRHLYRSRSCIERTFSLLKQFQRIAKRYEKTAREDVDALIEPVVHHPFHFRPLPEHEPLVPMPRQAQQVAEVSVPGGCPVPDGEETVVLFTSREQAQQYLDLAGWELTDEVGELTRGDLLDWLTDADREGVHYATVNPDRNQHLACEPQPVHSRKGLAEESADHPFPRFASIGGRMKAGRVEVESTLSGVELATFSFEVESRLVTCQTSADRE